MRTQPPLAHCSHAANTLTTIVLISLLLLTSCTKHFVVRLWNNSGRQITVATRGEPETCQQARSSKFKLLNDGEILTITDGTAEWTYRFLAPPESFLSQTATESAYTFQVSSNGLIYALDTPVSGIADNVPTQPAGFPLKPVGRD